MRGLLVIAPLLLLACAPPAKAPLINAQKPARAAPAPGPRERLAAQLRSIARPAPVLAALPPGALSRLQARFAGLDAQRKLAVQSDDGPLVENLPLLHLASGGTSPRALYALATTSAGSQELAGLLSVEPVAVASTPDAARVAIVRELAIRAALDFLRDRAADVALPGKGTALACRLVARAAVAVARRDLVLTARELLASVEPNPETRLEFAQELARSGDAQRAAQVLAEAQTDKRRPAPAATVAGAQRLIDAARTASAAQPAADITSKLQRARAWLRLSRVDEARALLEHETETAKTRLDLAAAVAETLIDNPSCPELPPDVGGAALCAVAFRASPGANAARALLESAWQSGAGRDDEAVEVYTALAHVIPWMQDTASELALGALRAEGSAERVGALRDKLAQIAAVSPKIAGLVLFLETVRSGPSPRAGLRTEAEAEALTTRALALAATDKSRFAQAGVLAAAAVLAHQRDVSPLVDAVPFEDTVPNLRVPRAMLGLWLTASSGSQTRLAVVRGDLATIMTEGLGGSLERARLVLGVSEVGALLDATDRSYQLLSRVSGQLLSDNVPPDLALRAVLDASGALAHGARFEQAAKILDGAATAELPEEMSRARDSLALIRGYELVLSARGAPVSALPRLRAGFDALATPVRGESPKVWFELWNREFDALQREADCTKKKAKTCREAEALRRYPKRDLDARLGAQAAAVLIRGALPSGSFDAGFRFSVENGLEPLIIFDPSVLAIGLPRFSVQ